MLCDCLPSIINFSLVKWLSFERCYKLKSYIFIIHIIFFVQDRQRPNLSLQVIIMQVGFTAGLLGLHVFLMNCQHGTK